MSREQARAIWRAAVDAVRPEVLLREAAKGTPELAEARRIVVVGAGKAAGAMAAALEDSLTRVLGDDALDRVVGWVNIPEGTARPTRKIHQHPARPMASNHPTAAGVDGSREILRLVREASADDVVLGLWSGGGSALLPLPCEGITLADKQAVTRLLHASGATINQMNAVRKHLSAIKGGWLADAFRGRAFVNWIISDVVGDPLDVIASGPTSPDPSTFVDAWETLERFGLLGQSPDSVRVRLDRGVHGEIPETPKAISPAVRNVVIGNNRTALSAAAREARRRGYAVVDLGSWIEGETSETAKVFAGIAMSVRRDGCPAPAPACVVSGGETTVTLGKAPGRGGRNQEFVLAVADRLGIEGLAGITVLSGGTDGEDGPTDAAGAIADAPLLAGAIRLGLSPADALARHDAYPFFEALDALLISGPTGTNVMDVRVILIDPTESE